MAKSGEAFERFVDVVKRLRDPNGGCPWDLEQDHESLRPYLIEESYEVLEAIEAKDDSELKKELGDLLLQVVLHAQVAKDRGAFEINSVIESITEKMIRRHPHVFGDTKVSGTTEVLKNWEKIKAEEQKGKQSAEGADKEALPSTSSMLSGVPITLPALIRAQRLGEKAAKVSFDWQELGGVWDKVNEELTELAVEVKPYLKNSRDDQRKKFSELARQNIEHELGDLLFSVCQLARWLGLSAEDALRGCCTRFTERFYEMERGLNGPLTDLNEKELEQAWQEAKKRLESTP